MVVRPSRRRSAALLPLPPLCAAVLEPNLKEGNDKKCSIDRGNESLFDLALLPSVLYGIMGINFAFHLPLPRHRANPPINYPEVMKPSSADAAPYVPKGKRGGGEVGLGWRSERKNRGEGKGNRSGKRSSHLTRVLFWDIGGTMDKWTKKITQ